MKKTILYSVIASETIHIFCCVLPTIFSVLSLLAGVGMIATLPGFVEELHHIVHGYEIFMIIMSACILFVGWCLYIYAQKINCTDEGGCCAEPCAPKKDRVKVVMIIATVLFIVNVSVYFGIHVQSDMHIAHG